MGFKLTVPDIFLIKIWRKKLKTVPKRRQNTAANTPTGHILGFHCIESLWRADTAGTQVNRTGWWLNAHNLPYHVVGRVWLCSYVLLKIKNCNQTKACLYFSRYSSDEISTNPSQHISISLIWRNENHEIWIRLDICVKRVYNHFGLLDKNVIAGPVR